MTQVMYVVMTLVDWNKVTADGKKLVTENLGFGFLPVFAHEDPARRKFPNHPIVPIEMEVPDEAEVSERPASGSGDHVPNGAADLHDPGQG